MGLVAYLHRQFGAQIPRAPFSSSPLSSGALASSQVGQTRLLCRLSLVRAAQLLGSDYTTGVKGVGIVNATEILSAFPGDGGEGRVVTCHGL